MGLKQTKSEAKSDVNPTGTIGVVTTALLTHSPAPALSIIATP